jgi:hypothetical protein
MNLMDVLKKCFSQEQLKEITKVLQELKGLKDGDASKSFKKIKDLMEKSKAEDDTKR